MSIITSVLEDLIPGVGQAKIGIILAVVGVLVFGVGGTIGYYKYENIKLENTVLSKQNDIDRAKSVIVQQKDANDSLVAAVNKQRQDIKTIVQEQEGARTTDARTQAAKDNLTQKLNDSITSATVPEAGDDDREAFLKAYNDNLECRRLHPADLTACQ